MERARPLGRCAAFWRKGGKPDLCGHRRGDGWRKKGSSKRQRWLAIAGTVVHRTFQMPGIADRGRRKLVCGKNCRRPTGRSSFLSTGATTRNAVQRRGEFSRPWTYFHGEASATGAFAPGRRARGARLMKTAPRGSAQCERKQALRRAARTFTETAARRRAEGARARPGGWCGADGPVVVPFEPRVGEIRGIEGGRGTS